MDAVAFPPPPAPFLDDGFDFGDFAFAAPPAADPQRQPAAAFDDDWGDFVASPLGSNPDVSASASAPATPPTAKPSSSAAWEKPRGPLPLSLFGADEEEEVEPPPTATAAHHQPHPASSSGGVRPADLKGLIAGLYGSQPPSSPGAPTADAHEDEDGFGDDGWEFKAAPFSDAGQVGGRRADGDGIVDMPNSMGNNQEEWSLFTSPNGNLNHAQTTAHIGTHESTGQTVKDFSYFPPNNASILDMYKESELVDAVQTTQCSAESVESSSVFSNNEMNSSFETDENHSIKSTNDRILIDFYHKLREESLAVISQYKKDLKEAQKSSMPSDENSAVAAIQMEIQEIFEKLHDCSHPKDLGAEEHPSKDICISELLNSTREDYLKDFEQEYRLAERITLAPEDMSSAVELYKHSVSTLHTLELASKEEQRHYVCAWYSLLLSCAQELQHGAVLWQESCHANACDIVISQGGHCFIALGEIYRVAQILHLSLEAFKPWVLADPGMLSKMLVCCHSCINGWTSGLETALRMVVDSKNLHAPVAKVLLESIDNISEIDVDTHQNFPSNNMACRLTLLPTSLLPGMKVIVWDGDHYFVKVANLWANRISSDPPQFSVNHVS